MAAAGRDASPNQFYWADIDNSMHNFSPRSPLIQRFEDLDNGEGVSQLDNQRFRIMRLLLSHGTNINTITNWTDFFPEKVKSVINEFRLSVYSIERLVISIWNIAAFLNEQKVEYSIIPDLFVDADYPYWREIKIRVRIKENLRIIYQKFEPQIYELVQKTLPEEILGKVLIKLETYNDNNQS